MRIGIGFDVHPLVEERPLVLGGVAIPYERGLDGHSDADVVLHAVMDAMLGALALGDIGQHFPNTDPRFRGADSRRLAREVYGKVREQGYRLGNLDVMVLCERPKLAPHIPAMRQVMANLFQVQTGRISVKATTTERLGFVGREEGVAAQAVVILQPVLADGGSEEAGDGEL
ncbi:2-C-methyl-D-erythritol 2,4-cyclodiphosphate synthase [Alicyclobacillus shizuokensis]|uniref:2-C-methyl-D-erythritol 2,4-cyclodiphosphate synthase n=1 Tax=Alicyclobacillus shizuokensis TaxID=392014 RepID=UPI000836A862|nr:2-C-methyl-D-erythritol 2,4-cyclodiphosphate synthase [Alicyclobacillus shizuokensis]MCL6625981.1 2-C-methyl-D-erythritol 2,4-cyclodiphosphate synthase [Alicyclobacillus shizuokensis]